MIRRGLQDTGWPLFLCGLLLVGAHAHAAGPSEDELQEVQKQLARARAVLEHPDVLLEEVHARALSSGLEKTEAALQRYLELSNRGKKRTRLMVPLAAAGATLVADDVTGVGVANDFLLPVVGLGLLATQLLTQAPAPETEVDKVWREVLAEMQATAQIAREVSASSSYIPPPNSLPGFPEAKEAKRKTPIKDVPGKLRKRWVDSDRILEWDSRHGRLEVYDKRGKHLGEFAPNSGKQLEAPVPGRAIKP